MVGATMSELTNAEAIAGFVAWLSQRKETAVIGNGRESEELPLLMDAFFKANEFTPITGDEWLKEIYFPTEVELPPITGSQSQYEMIARYINDAVAGIPEDDCIDIFGSLIAMRYLNKGLSVKETRVASLS